ncbi:MAG: type II secretion system F family protein [Rhodobacteraceae bacterium]|nr:type II secretion system F family protein [Paracoccaceae bacterium]
MALTFEYKALDHAGRRLAGRVTAPHRKDALRQIQNQGLVATSVTLEEAAPVNAVRFVARRSARSEDYLLVLKQLALLLNAAVPLVQAVATLKQQDIHPEISAGFARIEQRIRAGESFSTALTTGLPALPKYVFQLVAAGEAIGRLGSALSDATRQMEYDQQVRTDIKNALTYPSVLILVGIAAVIFIFIVVVPRFSAMLTSTQQDLPMISIVVLKTGMFLNEHALAIFAIVLGSGIVASRVLSSPKVRARIREFAADAPLIGSWLRDIDLASWSVSMATMLENGVDLIAALRLAREAIRIPSISESLDQVAKSVRTGKPLSAALEQQGAFNKTAINMIQVGEDSGELPTVLNSLATLYNDAARQRMKRFLVLLEPAAIVLVGGIIGGIVTAIMLAITSINQVAL